MIKMKKILSLIMAIAILVTTLSTAALPVGAVSASDSKAVSEETVPEETVPQTTVPVDRASTKAATSGTIGECTWYISGNTLTISGNGDMGDRHGFYIPWKNVTSSIYRVVVEEGVTGIGSYAFCECSNLTSVVIPDSVTRIGAHAFNNCSSLTGIKIPDSVTSIGEYAFEDCDSLVSFSVGTGLKEVGMNAFNRCITDIDVYIKDIQSWCEIDFANNYAQPLIYGGGLYLNGKLVTEINLPEETEKIGSYALYYCKSLTKITIPDTVTSIGDYAFGGCTSLTSITIPDSVINVGRNALLVSNLSYNIYNGGKYLGNTNNPYMVLVDIEETSITSFQIHPNTKIISTAFRNCDNLTSITIPNKVISIGSHAFYNRSSLTNITIPDSVTSIGKYAFCDCSGLTNITIFDSVTSIGDYAFSNCSGLTDITIPDSVTSIGDYAFRNCSSLTDITIPNSVTSIGDSAFLLCSSLTSVTIPDSVTNIGYSAFGSCSSLESITIPFVGGSKKTASDTYQYPFGYIFGSYTSGTATQQWYYGDSTTSTTYSTYYIPTTLKTVTVTGGEILCGAFYNCKTLTSITLPSDITAIGDYAFSNCSGLTNITIPDSVTSVGDYAFRNCSSLTDITIPDSVTSIGDYAFSSCSSLTGVTIPDSVTSIGGWAFYNCSSLTHATLGNGVTSIGNHALAKCSALTQITIPFVGASKKTASDTYQYPFGYLFGTTSYTGGTATTQYFLGATSTTNTTYYIPTTLKTVTVNGGNLLYGAFYNCTKLTTITIGKDVLSINTAAFTRCTGLERIEVSGDNPNYCSENGILYNKDKTEIIWAPANHKLKLQVNYLYVNGESAADPVTSVLKAGEAYSIEIPEILGYSTKRERISGTMPAEDLVVEVIYYENAKRASGQCNDSITWTVYEDGTLVFRGTGEMPDYTSGGAPWVADADKITSVYLDPRITSVGAYAFQNCSNLTFVDYGYSISSIGAYAFLGCAALKSFKLPASVTEISEGAFSGCAGLKSVVIPDNITAVGKNAFYGCSELIQATIGNAVTTIGDNAFAASDKLTQIYFCGSPATLGSNSFGITTGKYVYYYSTVSAWNDAITDGRWNGYTAIPYNAISKENFIGTNVAIIKVVDKHSVPLENAVVNFGGTVQSTNKDGMAFFVKPSGTQSLTVSCSDHITFSDLNFNASSTQIIDIIELSDRPSVIQGVRVNKDSIATSVQIVNCNSDETINITVSGYSKYTILKYELYQGNRLIATKKTCETACTFSVNTGAFEEEETVFVKMYTSDGFTVSSALNIDVISLADISEQQILQELSNIDLSFSLGALGSYKVPMSFTPTGEEKFYTYIKGRTIRVGINLDIGEFFEKNGENAPKSALQKMVNDSMKNYGKDKSGFEYNVCGYLEIEYLGDGQYYVKTNYVKLGVKSKLAFDAQASFYGIVGVYFKASLSGEATLDIKVTRYEPESGFGVEDLNFAMEDALEIEGGAYLLWGFGSAGLYGKAQMGFVLGIIPDLEFESVYINGEFGAKWSVLWGLYSGKYVIAQGDIYRYPEAQTYMMRTLSSSLYAAQQDPDSYELNDRAYLENRSQWLNGDYLQKNIYDNVAPKIVTCGDTAVMLWLDDNSARDNANFQTLYYSVYENGIWSAPVPVADNGTFDCEFDVYTDGEKIYVVYTEMTGSNAGIETLDVSSDSDISSFICNVEASVVVYENGSFGTPVQLTDNNSCEFLPHIAMVDGELTVVWMQSDSVGLDGQMTNNAIYSTVLGQQGWSAPAEYISSANTVSDITTVTLGNANYTVYIVDTDGSSETKDDQILVLGDESGNAVELATGFIANVGSADVDGKTALTWYNDGKIYMITEPDQKPICLVPEEVSVGTNYQIVSTSEDQMLLTFTMSNNDALGNTSTGTDIYSVYIDATGCLTAPVRLTRTGGYVVNYSVVEEDGKLVVVFTETFAEVSGDNVETVTHFRNAEIEFFTDIALDNVDFDITQVKENAQLDITLSISNNGINSIDGVTVHFCDANGQLLYTADCDAVLKSGEFGNFAVSLVLPQSILTAEYSIEIVPKQGMLEAVDTDCTDNNAKVKLAYADFSVVAEQKIIGEKNYLILSATNMGNVSSTAMIEIFAPNINGRKITGMETGLVAPGATEQYFVELNALTSSEDECVSCTISSAVDDPFLLNNTETVSLMHIDENVFKTDPEEVVHNPEISVNAVNFDKYTPQDITIEITAEFENFNGIEGLTKDTDFTVVGNIVTIYGTYVSGLPVGEHTLKLLFDYGYDAPAVRTLSVTVTDSTPVALAGSVDISGEVVVGNTVYADVSALEPTAAKIKYTWSIDGNTVSTENCYTIVPEDYGKTLTLTVCGTNGFTGELTKQSVVTLRTPDAPAAPVVSKIGSNSFDVVKSEGVEYSIDLVTWQDSAVFENLNPNTVYTVYARKKATETSFAGNPSRGTSVTTKKLAVAAPDYVQWQVKTHNTIELVYDSAMEYMIEGGNWTDNHVFTGLEPNTTYTFYQRYKETDTAYASESVSARFLTLDRIAISGEIAISGVPQFGEILTADLAKLVGDAESVTYQWYCDGNAISGATEKTYTLTKDDMGKTVAVCVMGADAYKGELRASVSVRTYVMGDTNDDCVVDTLDRMILSRYLANWEEYPADEINLVAMDLNGDTMVDTLDRMILSRHLANWEGYESLFALSQNQ